jgi:hypothetical protein
VNHIVIIGSKQLDRIEATLAEIQADLRKGFQAMSAEVDALKAAVASEDLDIAKLVNLVKGFPAQLSAGIAAAESGDTATVTQLVADVQAQTTAIEAVLPAPAPAAPAAPATPPAGQ